MKNKAAANRLAALTIFVFVVVSCQLLTGCRIRFDNNDIHFATSVAEINSEISPSIYSGEKFRIVPIEKVNVIRLKSTTKPIYFPPDNSKYIYIAEELEKFSTPSDFPGLSSSKAPCRFQCTNLIIGVFCESDCGGPALPYRGTFDGNISHQLGETKYADSFIVPANAALPNAFCFVQLDHKMRNRISNNCIFQELPHTRSEWLSVITLIKKTLKSDPCSVACLSSSGRSFLMSYQTNYAAR